MGHGGKKILSGRIYREPIRSCPSCLRRGPGGFRRTVWLRLFFPSEEAAQKFAKQFRAATKPRASDEEDIRLSKAKWNSWKEENTPSTKELVKEYYENAVAENPELFQALRDAEAAEKNREENSRFW